MIKRMLPLLIGLSVCSVALAQAPPVTTQSKTTTTQTTTTASTWSAEPPAGALSEEAVKTAVANAGLTGKVQVVAYDATKAAMDLMSKGTVSLVLAQKPFDMGYMAVEFAAADAAGVTSLPKRVETGFAILNKDNASDPAFSRFVYQVPGQ